MLFLSEKMVVRTTDLLQLGYKARRSRSLWLCSGGVGVALAVEIEAGLVVGRVNVGGAVVVADELGEDGVVEGGDDDGLRIRDRFTGTTRIGYSRKNSVRIACRNFSRLMFSPSSALPSVMSVMTE